MATESSQPERLVYRTISFKLREFNRLKECQRKLQNERGRRVSNSEALAVMLVEQDESGVVR